MNTVKAPVEMFLPQLHAWSAAVVGMLMLTESAILFYNPPTRSSVEVTVKIGEKSEKRSSTDADPSTLVIMLATAGAALVVYGMNGIRILRFSMKNVHVESLGSLSEPADKTLAAAQVKTLGVPSEVITSFLMRSSWNGLKVLKACQLASVKGKPKFNLRLTPVLGPYTSYDYCYGFLIAAISIGAVVAAADAETGLVQIMWVDETLVREIDRVMNGNVAVDPNMAAFKANEMGALVAYFEKL